MTQTIRHTMTPEELAQWESEVVPSMARWELPAQVWTAEEVAAWTPPPPAMMDAECPVCGRAFQWNGQRPNAAREGWQICCSHRCQHAHQRLRRQAQPTG